MRKLKVPLSLRQGVIINQSNHSHSSKLRCASSGDEVEVASIQLQDERINSIIVPKVSLRQQNRRDSLRNLKYLFSYFSLQALNHPSSFSRKHSCNHQNAHAPVSCKYYLTINFLIKFLISSLKSLCTGNNANNHV